MKRHAVDSSLLRSVGYDAELCVLEIELAPGRVYRYYQVPARVHRHLLEAPSPGAYFNREIRSTYPYEEITRRR